MDLFGYVRVSTPRQVKSPGGIDAQKEMIEKWCDLHDHNLVKIYSDPGRSTIGKRPQFEKLVKALEAEDAEGVVVTKLDRFGRSVQDLVFHTTQLESRDQHFISIGDSIDTSTHHGRLHFHIMAAFAEFERENIKERMTMGRKRAEENGVVTHRPKSKLIDPDEIEQLKELHGKRVSISAMARIFEVSRSTMYRRMRELDLI